MKLLLLAFVTLGALIALLSLPSFAHQKAGRRELLSYFVWRGVFVLGLLIGCRKGFFPALLVGFGGVVACFVADWLFLVLGEPLLSGRDRRGSFMQRLWKTHLPLGLGLSLSALGIVLHVEERTRFGELVVPSLVTLGFALVLLSFARSATLTRELLELDATVAHVEPLPPPRASREIEIGVGEGLSVSGQRGGGPYRDGQIAELLVHGAIGQGVAIATHATHRRVPAVAMVAMALGAVLASPSRSSPEETPRFAPVPAAQARTPAAAKPPQRSSDFRTYLSWYPQAKPIVEDLNGDGVEDVIGLRWDANNKRAALHVVANDGKTMGELWRSEGYPAQWAGRSTFLLRHGTRLFMTDGEGNLRVFGLSTGSFSTFADVPLPAQLCGVHDDPRVFLQTAYPADGWFIDPEGRREAGKRPERCDAIVQLPSCDNDKTTVCRPKQWPAFLAAERESGSVDLFEDHSAGVAIKSPYAFGASSGGWTIWGYEPKTRKKRYEVSTVFAGDVLHAKPDLNTKVSAGRVFVYYQQKNGSWRLGARDAASGEVLWKIEPPRAEMGTTFMNMHATDKRLYVALDHRLEVFDAATGTSLGVVW